MAQQSHRKKQAQRRQRCSSMWSSLWQRLMNPAMLHVVEAPLVPVVVVVVVPRLPNLTAARQQAHALMPALLGQREALEVRHHHAVEAHTCCTLTLVEVVGECSIDT